VVTFVTGVGRPARLEFTISSRRLEPRHGPGSSLALFLEGYCMDDKDEGLRDIKRALIRTMVCIIVESSLVPIDDEDREVIVQYKNG